MIAMLVTNISLDNIRENMNLEHQDFYGATWGFSQVSGFWDAKRLKSALEGLSNAELINPSPKTETALFFKRMVDSFDSKNRKKVIGWQTSAGNWLIAGTIENDKFSKHPGFTQVIVHGRRHGIPWRFLGELFEDKVIGYEYLKTQAAHIAPWINSRSR